MAVVRGLSRVSAPRTSTTLGVAIRTPPAVAFAAALMQSVVNAIRMERGLQHTDPAVQCQGP